MKADILGRIAQSMRVHSSEHLNITVRRSLPDLRVGTTSMHSRVGPEVLTGDPGSVSWAPGRHELGVASLIDLGRSLEC